MTLEYVDFNKGRLNNTYSVIIYQQTTWAVISISSKGMVTGEL